MSHSLFDENAEVLRQFEADGVDLIQERAIDFSFVFAQGPQAEAFARAVEQEGFSARLSQYDRPEEPWDVTASKTMTPRCANITDTEQSLDALAHRYGGRADGWGFMGV